MFCSKCGKEISNESEFCGYCGNKLNENFNQETQELDIEKEKTLTEIEKRSKILKIVIIFIISVLVLGGIIITLINGDSGVIEQSNHVVNEETVNTIEEQKEIAEENKVMVTFIDDTGNKDEVREIYNREGMVDYAFKHGDKVKIDLGINKLADVIYEQAGALYYFECDTQIDGYNKISESDYGSIMFTNYIKTIGNSAYYYTIATIWNPFTNLHNDYILIHEENSINNQPISASKYRDNNLVNILYNHYTRDMNCSNVRIGIIGTSINPWMEEKLRKQSEQTNTNENVQNEETTSNENYQEPTDAYNNYNNNNNYEITNNTNNSNNQQTVNEIKEEIKTTINIHNFDDSTTEENYKLQIFVNIDTNGEWYTEANKLTATVNGTTMTRNLSEGSISFSADLKLTKGSNNLNVTVTNTEGVTKSQTGVVTFSAPKPKISTFDLGSKIDIDIKNDNGSVLTEKTEVIVNGSEVKGNGYNSSTISYSYIIKEEDTTLNIVATNQYGESTSKTLNIK